MMGHQFKDLDSCPVYELKYRNKLEFVCETMYQYLSTDKKSF